MITINKKIMLIFAASILFFISMSTPVSASTDIELKNDNETTVLITPYANIGTVKEETFIKENYVNNKWVLESERVLKWVTLNVPNGFTFTFNNWNSKEYYSSDTDKLVYRTYYRTYNYKTY